MKISIYKANKLKRCSNFQIQTAHFCKDWLKTPNLMIWEKLFVWEKLCLWLYKIRPGMQQANLRSMACHCSTGMSAQFSYHSNYDLQIYTKHLPPMQLPGHQSITPSVAMTTVVMSFRFDNAILLRFSSYTPVLILKSEKLKFSQTNIFLKSINSLF